MLHRTRVCVQPCIPACSALPCAARRGACFVVRNRSAAGSVSASARSLGCRRRRVLVVRKASVLLSAAVSPVRFCFHSVGGRRTSAMPRRSTNSAGAMRARMAACRMRPAPSHICTGTGLTPATSAPGLRHFDAGSGAPVVPARCGERRRSGTVLRGLCVQQSARTSTQSTRTRDAHQWVLPLHLRLR
jgi:hypothetical protein